jgi:hypothetical protein
VPKGPQRKGALCQWACNDFGLGACNATPAGLAFLHRLVTAAHLVMNNMGSCGIRLVALMLGLAGVGPFGGLSYGAQQKTATKMQDPIIEVEAA